MAATYQIRLFLARAALTLLFSFALVACKGCGDDSKQEKSSPLAEAQKRALARMEDRGLRFAQTYPRRSDGSVDCKADPVCFVAQAKDCADSWFEHREEQSALGVTQVVHSRYRVLGKYGERCQVLRQVLGISAVIDEISRRAALEKGKTEAELQSLVLDNEAVLRMRNPLRSECGFTTPELLEHALDIEAEIPTDARLRKLCREVPPGAEWLPGLLAPSTIYPSTEPEAAPPKDAQDGGAKLTP